MATTDFIAAIQLGSAHISAMAGRKTSDGGVLALAVAGLFGDTGGWIDLRAFFAAVLAGYAAICAAGIGLAHFLYRISLKKQEV